MCQLTSEDFSSFLLSIQTCVYKPMKIPYDHLIPRSSSTCTACTSTYYKCFNVWNKLLKCTYVHLSLFHSNISNIQHARVKQNTLNFNIPTPLVTYHFSSTSAPLSTSCSPSSLCLLSLLLLEILKNWKEKGNNRHHKHMFSEIRNKNCFSTEAHRGFVLDREQKIKTQLQTIWP